MELQAWSDKQADPLVKGLMQIEAYLEALGLNTGVLVVFDRRSTALAANERTRFEETKTHTKGYRITLLRA